MKRVLIICSLFPPAGGPGAKRISQFVKYLVLYDWEPIVLTHRNFFMGYDPHSLKKIPSTVRVYRTRSLEQYFREANTNHGNSVYRKMPNKKKRKKYLNQTIKNVFRSFAPDSAVLWMPFALWGAGKIYKQNHFDTIFATGSAFSNFLTGSVISKLTKKPLILDFRDAWAANPDLLFGNRIQLFMARLYEKIAISTASYVIANTRGVQEDFIARYPKQRKDKFIVIHNGFDEDDFNDMEKFPARLEKDKFNIVHTGSLGGIRTPRIFLEAISELIKEDKIIEERIMIHLIGLSSIFHDGCSIEDYITRYQLSQCVALTGFISRKEAFRFNARADLLLLVIGVTPKEGLLTYGLSGKIYDYILARKPIFALSQKGGATYDFLTKNEIGIIANPTDKEDIKYKISATYTKWAEGKLTTNYDSSRLSTYNMKNLTRYLSKILDVSLRKKEL